MKIIYEASDIEVGKVYGKDGYDGHSIMVGYYPESDEIENYVIINLSDGCISVQRSKFEVAKYLTDNDYIPEEIL
jgi:hypothetical protein